jgi:hypothetical protein
MLARISSAVFVPDDGLRLLIAVVDIATVRLLKVARASMYAPAELLLGQRREPALDEVEPRGFGR